MQFRRIDSTRGEWTEQALDEALAPGVSLTRRRVVRTGLLGLTALASGACGALRSDRPSAEAHGPDALSLGDFVARTRRMARELVASSDPDEPA
ncbi:MAG: hypothetical protein AAFP86_24245, partial [Planctomycetota bacterium]